MDSEGIIKAIDDLKTALKGDNAKLQQNIDHLGHEINGKLDNIATEVQGLTERVDEAETRVHQVETWAKEATEALCMCIEQQRKTQLKSEEPVTADGGSGAEASLRALLGWQPVESSGAAVALRAKNKLQDFQRSMAE
ncbi:unnamed protein product [Menidia menidia]|uniref:(Atlantic silverside) hypothetical protein n=1 Tax=Menidia menidia TaxID=238744 RepID=A0A8S4BUY5_9TELE|nr:unnamed protein product [Menidia menidia]